MTNENLRFVPLLPLLFRLGGAVEATCASAGCFGTIANAQDCLRQCTNLPPNVNTPTVYYGDMSSSLLGQCLGPGRGVSFHPTDVMLDLIGCCGMTGDCPQTMQAARFCATGQGCIDPCVKQTAIEYLQCVQAAKVVGTCPFADFCMGTMFNDPQLDANGQPILGTNSLDFGDILGPAAVSAVAGSTCDPFAPFVSKVCQLGGNCCSPCNEKLGALTNCLVNNFVLSLYKVESGNVNNALQCPVSSSPCGLATGTAAARGGSRGLEEEDVEVDESNQPEVNITECEQALTLDWIAYNESYAAGQFFNCIGEKMVQIIAQEDATDSASSPSLRTMASFGVSSLIALTVASFL